MIARCDQGHEMSCAGAELDRRGRTVGVTWRCRRCAVDLRVTARGVTTAPMPSWLGGPRSETPGEAGGES